MELVVLRILNACFVLCKSALMALFMVFNLWIGPGFIFESCS